MDEDNLTPATETPQVDKVNEQISETSNPVNNEAPEATQSTEEKQTDTNSSDKADEKLFAGKFKTAEDMEKAYTELQSKATKDAMQKAELAKTVNSTLAEQTEGYYGNDQVAAKLDALERNNAVSNFTITHPDANVDEVDGILRNDPVVQSINSYEGRLEYAYLKSQSMATGKAVEEAKKKAAQDTQAKIVEKQAAQVESSRKAEQVDNAELYTQATTGNRDERDEARLALIRKHLTNL